MNTSRLCILFLFPLTIYCNPIKDTSLKNKVKPLDNSSHPTSHSEVSGCKIEATILSIDSLLNQEDPGSPCSKTPCIARIKINEILKMGQMCGPMIYRGAELKVYFAFTLSETTKDLFPDLVVHYPGLKKNDTFVTSIASRFEKKDNAYQAIVYAYNKIN